MVVLAFTTGDRRLVNPRFHLLNLEVSALPMCIAPLDTELFAELLQYFAIAALVRDCYWSTSFNLNLLRSVIWFR